MNDGDDAADYRQLTQRPGFLVRRLHQIHLALFAEECAAFELTPVQYSIMTAIQRQSGLDQVRLGEQVGIDRATMADVLARLEKRGLVTRRRSGTDGRLKLVSLSASGRRLLVRIDPHAERAHERTVAALPARERQAFIRSLTRLVEAGHAMERAPLRPLAPRDERAARVPLGRKAP
jgi:MarR family transcriptional regulator, lower aerobic nicotinate degradation pathway regulator